MKFNRLIPALLAAAGLAASANAQVRIAEIYGGGGSATATFQEDYVVLYNAGASAQSLVGWSVQYTSATGTFSAANTASLTGSIAPGGYYLVKMSSGTGIGNIPAPDFSNPTNIAMSATVGKVALSNSTSVLVGTCPVDAAIQDFVGYGTTANCREGTATADNAPAPSTTNADIRLLGGCFDTGNNKRDFVAAAATPRNSSTSPTTCSPATDLGVALSTGAPCPATLASPLSITFTVTNNGLETSNGTLTVNIPTGLTFNSSTPSGTFSVNTLTVSLPAITPGNSQNVSVDLTPTVASGYAVSATIASSVTDPVVSNDSVSAPVLSPESNVNLRARFSNLAGSPNALVPTGYSVAGAEFFFAAATSQETFGRPYLSQDGTKFVMRCRSNQATTIDDFLMVAPVDGSSAPTFIAQEGVTDFGGGELLFAIDATPSVNNNGDVGFSGDTTAATTADEVVVKKTGSGFTIVSREGQAIDGSTIGTAQNACSITNSGNVLFSFVGTPLNTVDARLVEEDGMGGFTVIAAEGTTVPSGQAGGGSAAWSTFDSAIASSPERSSTGDVLIAGALVGTLETIALNGAVSSMDGATVAGGVVTAITGAEIRGSHVIVFGSNTGGNDWVTLDGASIAVRGQPIFTGATELWSDVPFSSTYFVGVTNANGDYVIGGTTDSAVDEANAVLVFNGTTVVARENDPVDVNNDGIFNDDAYIRTFRNDRAFLTDNGTFCFVAEVRSGANTCSGNAKTADTFICVSLGGAAPTPCELADFNDVDGVTADDIFAFLDAWFAQNGVCVSPATCSADINGVDDVTADDIFAFLDLWFTFNGTNPCP